MTGQLAALPATADQDRTTDSEQGPSTFVRNVESLLARTEYRRCDKGEDLEEIYRLRYKAYRSNDMVPDSESLTIQDDLDETPNAHRFGVYIDQQLVSTLRIHHVTRQTPWSPSTKAFGEIVYPMLDAGETFVCLSRFASDPDWTGPHRQLPFVVLRLAPMACFHFQASYGLSTVRDDHAGFYKRIFESEQISEPRSYPGVFNKVVLYRTNAHSRENKQRFFARFPFFKSTAMEQRLLFSPPADGELAPLTILPTAKYYRDAA